MTPIEGVVVFGPLALMAAGMAVRSHYRVRRIRRDIARDETSLAEDNRRKMDRPNEQFTSALPSSR